MFQIITWNCRGAKRRLFLCDLRRLIRKYSPDVVLSWRLEWTRTSLNTLPLFGPPSPLLVNPILVGQRWILGYNPTAVPVHFKDHISFSFLGVYGEPTKENRLGFIQSLSNLVPLGPCLPLGDLNITLSQNEKCGGSWDKSFPRRIAWAWKSLNLIDLGFIGSPFTWSIHQG